MDKVIEMDYESKGKTYILRYFPEDGGLQAYAQAYDIGAAPSVGMGPSGEFVAGVDVAADETIKEVFEKLKKAIDEL
jgi:hypothetical protein